MTQEIRQYNYFVLDFGVTNQYTKLDFLQCDTKLAICDLSSWHQDNLVDFIANYSNNIRGNVIFLGNPGEINQSCSTLKSSRVSGLKMLRIPFFENPFHLTSQYFGFLKKIIERN